MADQIQIPFADGQPVLAQDMAKWLNAYNTLVAEVNAITSQTAQITKSQELVRAYKAGGQPLTTDGTANTIAGWTAELNRDSIFNATSGLLTMPENATYRIDVRSFISINNATRIRAKLSLAASGAELSKCEANSYGTATTISNYRQDLYTFAQTVITAGAIVSANLRIWDAASGNIPVENQFDTFMTVSRIY